MIIKTLKSMGLLKVNEEYFKVVDKKLGEIDADLASVTTIADSSSQILDALHADNIGEAVKVALEFCKIDDEMKQLQAINEKIENNVSVDAALSAADMPKLSKEILESIKREMKEHYSKIAELLPNIHKLSELISEKLANIVSAAADWSFFEKLGTTEAARSSGVKIKQVLSSAEKAKNDLSKLMGSIDDILSDNHGGNYIGTDKNNEKKGIRTRKTVLKQQKETLSVVE